MLNNFQRIAKKYIFDLLQKQYSRNEPMITRISHYLTSENDAKDFCQIVADAWSEGYTKAVNDYRKKLSELGYEVEIKPQKEG